MWRTVSCVNKWAWEANSSPLFAWDVPRVTVKSHLTLRNAPCFSGIVLHRDTHTHTRTRCVAGSAASAEHWLESKMRGWRYLRCHKYADLSSLWTSIMWNNLPQELKLAKSLQPFKSLPKTISIKLLSVTNLKFSISSYLWLTWSLLIIVILFLSFLMC